MKAKDLIRGMSVETAKGVKVVQQSSALNPRLWRLAMTDGVTVLFCPPDTDVALAMTRAEQEAFAVASKPVALRKRLLEARGVLTDRKQFGKGTFDFAHRRLIGDNGLALQWSPRMEPDQPISYRNQQTTRGCVTLVCPAEKLTLMV